MKSCEQLFPREMLSKSKLLLNIRLAGILPNLLSMTDMYRDAS